MGVWRRPLRPRPPSSPLELDRQVVCEIVLRAGQSLLLEFHRHHPLSHLLDGLGLVLLLSWVVLEAGNMLAEGVL